MENIPGLPPALRGETGSSVWPAAVAQGLDTRYGGWAGPEDTAVW